MWRVRWLLRMMYSRLWNQGRAHVCPWYEATDASGAFVMVRTTAMPVHLTNTSSTIHALALAIAVSPRHVTLMVIAVSTETASDKASGFDETSNRRRRLVPPQPAESELGQRLDTCFSALYTAGEAKIPARSYVSPRLIRGDLVAAPAAWDILWSEVNDRAPGQGPAARDSLGCITLFRQI